MPCVTSNDAPPKVPACATYAIDVQPIPPRQRNNRVVHHGYLNHLRDTLDTLREIVEEARCKQPFNNNLDYACVYTKQSQELLENVSASCLKADNKQDTIISTTPATRKKHVTFANPLENPPKYPKSNKMDDRTLPANSVPEKKVEDHHRKNKSKLSKKNHVDSSTSVRRIVLDTNSNSHCKICNECISSINHDTCVENFLKSSKTSSIGKFGESNRNATHKVLPVKQWKPTGRLIPLGGQYPLAGSTALTSDIIHADPQAHTTPMEYNLVCTNQQYPNCNWGSFLSNSSFLSVFKCRSYRSSFGFGHNLFSVGQFCDLDLEAAFRKHTCFVRDLDGVNLIKGSRGLNLYTISVEDMMRRLRLTHGMTPWQSPVLGLADGTCSTMDDHDQRLEGQSRIKG
nr:integrase, catalytic region, zinc finger, CCHC-type, peptidase aspartic, catalytic [Tanacetum cinerariifolium]